MSDLTLTTEFVNRRQMLEAATNLIRGVLEGLEHSDSRQFEALQIAVLYLFKLDKVLAENK